MQDFYLCDLIEFADLVNFSPMSANLLRENTAVKKRAEGDTFPISEPLSTNALFEK
jgi:hypothetical protein